MKTPRLAALADGLAESPSIAAVSEKVENGVLGPSVGMTLGVALGQLSGSSGAGARAGLGTPESRCGFVRCRHG
jgi:hypothetical protein